MAYTASANTLISFVAYLYNKKLAPSSIKTQLAAITHEQISMGLGTPQITQIPQLEYVVKV